jgi:hypothetical protein
VLTVPAERLGALATHGPALGDMILRACLSGSVKPVAPAVGGGSTAARLALEHVYFG